MVNNYFYVIKMSILTFNLSVSDKNNVAMINEPFQIMPSTRNFLSNKSIDSYPNCKNENIILHMNYITRIFRKDALENGSTERKSLIQYAKLAKKLGTKNILIHMPNTIEEVENIGSGFKIMYDELLSRGITVHLEITAWSKALMERMKIFDGDPKEYVSNFVTKVVGYMNLFPPNSFYIVFDTAHMFSDGCEVDDMIFIMTKFKNLIKYIHLNGNVNYKFTSDSHAPLFTSKNRIKNWEKLSKFCASLNAICIAEITKIGANWENWEKYANDNGFKLVKYNENYSY